MPQLSSRLLTLLAAFLLGPSPVLAGGEFAPADLKFFEAEVRPLLVKHCQKCHGDEKQKGGLRLDHRAALLTGGDTGETVVPGKPDESLLMEAIRWESYEMPPSGQLDDKTIAVFAEWIKRGAPWPKELEAEDIRPAGPSITEEDRAWWAYQPLRDPKLPDVADDEWTHNGIDRFILRKLRENGLTPAEEADRRTLIRRVTYDLTGLPPTPQEVDAFLKDERPDHYEQLVNRLLESPRYGEHWGKHWLDLVRYAESDGYRQDAYRKNAWRYRDYVIDSLNADKPYNRFVHEQIAGDELFPHDPEAVVATGFLNHGIYEFNQRDVMTQWRGMVDEVTDTTADVFLGMGFGCAKCHDHKFDPILQKDYYRLRAFFTPIRFVNERPVAETDQHRKYEAALARWERETASVREQIAEIERGPREKLINSQRNKFPTKVLPNLRKPDSERSPFERQIALLASRQYEPDAKKLAGAIPKAQREEYDVLKKQLAEFDHLKPTPLPTARAVVDIGPEAPPTSIPGRERLGELEPGFPTIWTDQPADLMAIPTDLPSTGRRATLAHWLTDPEQNPLPPRVMVNRLWQHHFGDGLVSTASDFGRLGDPPSHPDLLDWLAVRFVESGWSLKTLHRLMVTSATYRQQAVRPGYEAGAMTDPRNRLLWRMPVRRLSAEQIRDSFLAVSGELDRKSGGPSVDSKTPRRSVYTKLYRNRKDELLAAFDVPGGLSSTPKRNVTTTPTQSLLMINGDWTLARATALADRTVREAGTDPSEQIASLFQRLYGRNPGTEELEFLVSFLARGTKSPDRITSIPGTDRFGLRVSDGAEFPAAVQINAPADDRKLPTGDFTIEASVHLDSLYRSASVRTIVSQWDNSKTKPGWSLGVTSSGSKYTPRNLIFQFVGQDSSGKVIYEVVPSGLFLELDTTYRVAATVEQSGGKTASVRFTVKRVGSKEPELHKTVATKVLARTNAQGEVVQSPLVIGGRIGGQHRWDGLIGDIRLSGGIASAETIGTDSPEPSALAALWLSNERPEGSQVPDETGHGFDLQITSNGPSRTRLIDLCHVLLNSSEFLYVE